MTKPETNRRKVLMIVAIVALLNLVAVVVEVCCGLSDMDGTMQAMVSLV